MQSTCMCSRPGYLSWIAMIFSVTCSAVPTSHACWLTMSFIVGRPAPRARRGSPSASICVSDNARKNPSGANIFMSSSRYLRPCLMASCSESAMNVGRPMTSRPPGSTLWPWRFTVPVQRIVNGTVGHRLVEAGRSVLFAPAYRLVQDLLAAKRDLALPRQLRKLDSHDFLLLDDLGYLPQGAEESEVLFTLIAERYERRSLGITSNLVFSQWEHIFANSMATAAAIDRVVHHSVILEFDVHSYRTGVAQKRGQEQEVNRQE